MSATVNLFLNFHFLYSGVQIVRGTGSLRVKVPNPGTVQVANFGLTEPLDRALRRSFNSGPLEVSHPPIFNRPSLSSTDLRPGVARGELLEALTFCTVSTILALLAILDLLRSCGTEAVRCK